MTSTPLKPVRWSGVLAFMATAMLLVWSASAQDRSFSLQGSTLRLQDLSAEADVFFQSMRFNRASNVWNVEVTIRNKGPRDLNGPILLSVETVTGTSGLIAPDGIGEGSPGKPFYDLTALGQNGLLAPGQSTRPRTLKLAFTGASPVLTTKVFASRPTFSPLVLTRSINDAGVALGDVVVQLAGTIDTNKLATEARSGLVTLPGTNATWKFSKTNHLSSWRTFNAGTNPVVYAPSPRLTPKSTNTIVIGVASGGTVVDGSTGIAIAYEPGSFNTEAPVTLTALTGQGLPGFLPLGWSPLQAFWLDVPLTQARSAMASVKPCSSIATNESAVIVRWSEELAGWVALQTIGGNGANAVAVPVDRPGVYAVVVPDASPIRPPTPAQGTLLTGVETNGLASGAWSASGRMNPPSRAASRNPDLVTAQAELLFTNSSGLLPSGAQFFCDLTEVYQLRSGSRRVLPGRDGFFVAYQRGPLAATGSLQSSVPIRPSLLLAGDELSEAVLRIDVLTPDEFRGGVLATNGGQIAQGDLRVVAGLGSVDRDQAAIIRGVAPTNFNELASAAFKLLSGFELGVGDLGAGRRLALQGNVPLTNGLAVLARVLNEKGEYGLEPLERFSTDASGKLTSLEPASGERLPGLDGSGQFVLVGVQLPQVLLSGIARNVTSQPAEGLSVRSAGTPWLTFSRFNGLFRLLSPAGPSSVQLRSLATSDDGEASLTLTNGIAATGVDVALSNRGPKVVSIQPTNTATSVSRVASVSITFSRAMNPATLATGIGLFGTGGQAIPAAVSLNLAGTVATLQPAAQLAASTLHQVVLSTNLVDLQGRRIEGPLAFSFTTEAATANRALAALTIYEPTTNGLVALYGAPGSAEPEAPVILLNETSGRTATILSKPDGSFTNFIEGTADDFVSAVVVNRNGTRTTIPASRQVFRNGSIGLFNGGGILEAQSDVGPQEVVVEAGAIPQKTILQITPLQTSQINSLTNDTPPAIGQVLGGMMLKQEGDELKVGADVSFPFDPVAAGVTNPAIATYVLTVPREIDGVIAYEVIDKLEYENGKLVTHSPPFTGALFQELSRRFKAARSIDSKSSKILKLVGLPSIKDTAYNVLMLPLLMSQGTKVIVIGETASFEFDADGKRIDSTKRLITGATVTFAQEGFTGREGRLQPGATFTTSGSDGQYSITFPINRLEENGFTVRSTHPAFPGQRSVRPISVPSIAQQFRALAAGFDALFDPSNLSKVIGAMNSAAAAATISPRVRADLEFSRGDVALASGTDAGPPQVSMTASTPTPSSGTNSTNGLVVTVSALDDVAAVTLGLTVTENIPLSAIITNNPVTISAVANSKTNIGTRFVQQSFLVQSQFRANVRLRATATDGSANLGEAERVYSFGADPVPIPAAGVGPRVLAASPANGSANVTFGAPVKLDFSKPLPVALPPVDKWLTVAGGTVSSVQLSDNRRGMTVFITPNAAGGGQILTINDQLLDETGVAFDQDPVATNSQSFSLQFTYADPRSYDLPGLQSGGGVVVNGAYAYALERTGSLDGSMVVYDLRTEPPTKVGELSVPGYPRDLAMIPHYSYKLKQSGPTTTGNLVAVVGGVTGAETFQYLWIIDVSNPVAPKRVAGAIISAAIAAVTKVQWAPPLLGYLESGADQTSVGIVQLQTFLIGMNADSSEIAQFPADGTPGKDLNGDGDFVDANEELPLPEKIPAEYFGKFFSFVDADSNRRIEDFSLESGGIAALVLSKGKFFGSNGLPDDSLSAPPAYRTVLKGLGPLNPATSILSFPVALTPKRVAVMPQVVLGTTTNQIVRDLAAVSLTGASNVLAVIDITDAGNPSVLRYLRLDQLGIPQSLIVRDDGLLALAMSSDVILLDPKRFLLPDTGTGLPPAVVGVIPGAGSGGRSFASTVAGVSAVNLGGKHKVFFNAPAFKVSALRSGDVDPSLLWVSLSHDEAERRLRLLDEPDRLTKTPLFIQQGTNPPALGPVNRSTHFYVRVDAFGGLSADGKLPLLVRSLNAAGLPMRPGSPNALPVLLASQTTLPLLGSSNFNLPLPRQLTARRLSDDPASSHYNIFLAGPLVLSDQPMTSSQATQVGNQLARAVMRPGRYLQVGLDPTQATKYYPTGFVSKVAGGQLSPGTVHTVPVLHVPRPVVFIPGMAGSHLENKSGGGLLSLGITERWPGYIGKFQEELSLDPVDYPNSFPEIVPSDAIRQTPESYTVDVFFLPNSLTAFAAGALAKTYTPLLDHMTKDLGYVEYDYTRRAGTLLKPKEFADLRVKATMDATQSPRSPNLFVYPYDFRRSSASNAMEMKAYLEVVRAFNPEADQIDIVSHSNGGLVARRFILENPGTVHRFVSLAGPFLGAPKIVSALETGDLDDMALNFVLKPKLGRKLMEYFQGFMQLLPSQGYFDLGGRPMVEVGWDLNENGVNMEEYDMPKFRQAMDTILHPRTNVQPVSVAGEFQSFTTPLGGQDNWSNDGSGVDYVHIYTVQKSPSTIAQVQLLQKVRDLGEDIADLSVSLYNRTFTEESDTPIGGAPTNALSSPRYILDRRFEVVRGFGDGTVPEISLSRIGGGKNYNAPGARLVPFYSPSQDKDDQFAHNPMCGNPAVLAALGDALSGLDPTNAVPAVMGAGIRTGRERALMSGGPDYHRIEVINAEQFTAEMRDASGRSTAGTELPFNSDLSQRLVTWLTGLNEDEVNQTCVEFNIPSGAVGGPFKIICKATEPPLAVVVTRFKDGVPDQRTLYGGRLFATGSEVTITVPSNPDSGLTFAPNPPALVPTVTLSGNAARNDDPPFVSQTQLDSANDILINVTTVDPGPVGPSRRQIAPMDRRLMADTPTRVLVGEDDWDDKTIETEILAEAVGSKVDTTQLDAPSYQLVAVDARGNAGPLFTLDPNLVPASPACDVLDSKRSNIRKVLVDGLNQALSDGWLLSTQHVKALEQGSGACLWQKDAQGNLVSCQNCPKVFDPKKSDHDIELFFPCFLGGVPLNLTAMAHDSNTMAGDWYFRRPVVDGENWRYDRPGGGSISRSRTIFTNFAPSEIIANILNGLGETEPQKTILREISFFPVRFEYFTNALIDVESVGAYLSGSDPIGDAGLGRQLLLLKWLLEGEWVDSGSPTYDLAGPDLNTIWQRLANRDIPRLEGLEWCELHQNSAWSSGFMLRTLLPPTSTGETPRGVQFLKDRAKKQVKTLGKAAIRTTMALLAGLDEQDTIFTDSRNSFRQHGYLSYEGYIAGVASNKVALLGPYGDMLDSWLKAKLGDEKFMKDILTNDCNLNTYLQRSIQFIFFARDQVFANHEVDMSLLTVGSPADLTQYSRRTNNLGAIRKRITSNTASTSLDLELLLKNQSAGSLSGTVEMKVTGQSTKQKSYTIAAHTNLLIKGVAKSNIDFFITLPNSDTVLHDVQITVPTPGTLHELRLDNNFVEFACYILNLTAPCDSTTDYVPAPPQSLFSDDKLSSPFRMVDKLDIGFLPGVDGQFLANKYKEVFGKFPEKIFVVGSRTLGNNFGDIDTVFVSDRVIDRDGKDRAKAWDLFKKVNPQLATFLNSNGITGIGQPTPDNPNPRGLGYDPDDIPKAGTVDTIFATYYEMTRPGVLIWKP